MSQIAWGNYLWEFMHYMSFKYPEHADASQRAGTLAFLRSLVHVIPCDVCKAHYSTHIGKSLSEEDVTGRTALVAWVASLHNDVNKSLNRSQWNLDRVKQKYEHKTCDCGAPSGAPAPQACGLNRVIHRKRGHVLRAIFVILVVVLLLTLAIFACTRPRRTAAFVTRGALI